MSIPHAVGMRRYIEGTEGGGGEIVSSQTSLRNPISSGATIIASSVPTAMSVSTFIPISVFTTLSMSLPTPIIVFGGPNCHGYGCIELPPLPLFTGKGEEERFEHLLESVI